MENIFEPNNAQYIDVTSVKGKKLPYKKISEKQSGFDWLGIGKPSAKQIVKWEQSNPSKITDLLKKGTITQGDIDLANTQLSYTPASNVAAIIATLPFSDTTSFVTYIQNGNFDKATLQGMSDALSSVNDDVSNSMTASDIAISLGTFAGKPINSSDAAILTTIAADSTATDFLNTLINPPAAAVSTDSGLGATTTDASTGGSATTDSGSTTKSGSMLIPTVLTLGGLALAVFVGVKVVKHLKKHGNKAIAG